MENKNVVIGWIDPGTVMSGFIAYTSQMLLHRNDLINSLVVASGPYLSLNRNKMVEGFLQTDAEWLLSLDSDLLIDLDSFDEMIKHANKETNPIVGGKYFIPLGGNIKVSAQKKHPEVVNGGQFIEDNSELINEPLINNLHSVGAGFMLVHRSVFETIAENSTNPYPWFQDYWQDHPYDSWISDDIHFFKQVHKHGFNVSLSTRTTSTHLKTSKIDESVFIDFNKFNKEKNANPLVNKRSGSWRTKGKNK